MAARVVVQEGPFDAAAEAAALTAGRTDVGAVASFVGLCRADDGLSAMALEHYPGMTERALRRIAAEAERRWPLRGVTVVHRHGRIRPGEGIVLVLCASAHRQAAFEACAFLMDWLKTKAPFWKREEFLDGRESRWVDAHEGDDAAASRWDEAGAAARRGGAGGTGAESDRPAAAPGGGEAGPPAAGPPAAGLPEAGPRGAGPHGAAVRGAVAREVGAALAPAASVGGSADQRHGAGAADAPARAPARA